MAGSLKKYAVFFIGGATGVLINLAVTWALTTFVLGLGGYFYAYLIGTGINFVYNFIYHTAVTFKTKEGHATRFLIFVIYMILMTAIQAILVNILTPIIGLKYYLFIIAGLIFIFSIITFFVFKRWLFNEQKVISPINVQATM